MGTIKVSVQGQPLFEWTGDAEAIDNIERDLAKLVESRSFSVLEFAKASTGYVAERGHFITPRADIEMMAIAYCIARAPSTHPDHPGALGDYLPMWDFALDITPTTDDRFNVEIVASSAATEGLA